MNNKTKKTSWQTTDKRFIAFLDIMGFKDLVIRNPHEFVYKMLNEVSEIRSYIEQKNDELDDYYIDSEIYTVSFSDSILLFSKTDSIACFDLLTFATRFLFSKAIEKNIPLKGAIAHGELSINKSKQIFFGQPLIDAFLLQEELKYYGVVVHHSIENYLDKNKDSLKTRELYFECPTPLKSGVISHKNLNWFTDLEDTSHPNRIIKYEDVFKEKMNFFKTRTSGDPRKYIDNTIKVFNEQLPPTRG